MSSRLTLDIGSAPEAGDRIEIDCSTRRLRIALITPNGQRITADNASTSNLDWLESPFSEPDWGKSVIITFRQSTESGPYIIEVLGQTIRASKAVVSFFSRSERHLTVLKKAFPEAIVASPVRPPETITFNVKENEKASLIDVLASDPAIRIALTLPDGRTVTRESAASLGVEWITTDDPFTQRTGVAGLLFPRPGRHHLFYFKEVPAGAYHIRALGSGQSGEIRALFLPYERGWDRYLAELSSRTPEPGKVYIRVWNPRMDCFVGESLDLSISLEGDTVQGPPIIAAYYDSPTRPANLPFFRREDGRYHATFVTDQPGALHLTFRAQGQTNSGVSFSDERQLPEVIVQPRANPVLSATLPPPQAILPPQNVPSRINPACPVSLISATRPGEKKREGRVVLTARIDEQGRAHDVKVIRPVDADLDREAIQYVEQCGRYSPRGAQVSIEVHFLSL